MNNISMELNADALILSALREDLTSEDITTNSVMPHYQAGEVDLICKQDGVIAGLEVFKRVFELLDENPDCDMVAAFQNKRKEGAFISRCKELFYKAINKVSEVDLIADASDFRTVRRCVVETILALPEYHRFSKGIFSWVGYNTLAMPYEVKERESGETKWSFMQLVKYALEGITAYTDMPLRLPVYTGGVMLMLSVLMLIGFAAADIFYVDFNASMGYLASLVLFVGAVICIFLGILGYYVSKIHIQVRQRPIFIAKEILTYDNKD